MTRPLSKGRMIDGMSAAGVSDRTCGASRILSGRSGFLNTTGTFPTFLCRDTWTATPSPMMPRQASLFDAAPPGLTDGLFYAPAEITPAEEQACVARFEALPFKPYEFRGYLGNRRSVSFGGRYDHNRLKLEGAQD